MAEIEIERKPSRRGTWTWIVALTLLVIVGAAAWYFLAGPGRGTI